MLERIYKISKILENGSVWVGRLGFIMNTGMKSRVFSKLALVLIRWAIATLEIRSGHSTKKFFSPEQS